MKRINFIFLIILLTKSIFCDQVYINDSMDFYDVADSKNATNLNFSGVDFEKYDNTIDLNILESISHLIFDRCKNIKIDDVINNFAKKESIKSIIINNCPDQKSFSVNALTSLYFLKINDSNLSDFPKLDSCNELLFLDLSRNELQRFNFPFRLKKLKKLLLFNNQIKNIDSSILNCPRLTNFSISGNLLTEIPEFISKLCLKELSFASNNITVLPPKLFFMPLEELYMSQNKIAKIPEEFFDLGELKSLNISRLDIDYRNFFEKVMSKNLFIEELGISNSKIFDKDLEPLQSNSIKVLWCQNNFITKIPSLKNLEVAYLENNKIESIGNDLINTRMKKLYLNGNNIKVIDPKISKISNTIEFISFGHQCFSDKVVNFLNDNFDENQIGYYCLKDNRE